MHNAGLATIVINTDTIAAARKARKNIWEEARVKITMVLVSPEELKSSEFGTLLDNETFSGRVYAMGVDEVHHQIGFVRAWLLGHNGIGVCEGSVFGANVGRESLCTFRAGKVLNRVKEYVKDCS